jgi:hypothetical protein
MDKVIKIFILVCLFISSIYFIQGKTTEAIYFILISLYNKPNDSTTINL